MNIGVVSARDYEALAAVAHDLRLPLSHIKGFVSSLRRADVDWDEQTRSVFLAEIDLETDRLTELVDSLLASGVRAGSLVSRAEVAFTDPVSVLDGALHRIRSLLGGRTVRRKVPTRLPTVPMDANQMERVLTNLLQNAIKYSPRGTPIGVSARITTEGELEFTIDDEGTGVRAEDRARIFEPFYRKHTATQSNVPGHGLGLAICQSIVLAHGGRMRVTDRRGGGARFSVFVPGPPRTESTLRCAPRDQPFECFTAKDGTNDPTKDSRRRRRGADAQASQQQPEGQRLRRAPGGGWYGRAEADRGARVRPVAA
jgi:two-component system sensor histidine kinase KdpD